MFITESWFWRGTQSAIFYYISCSPCVEFKYKQQRRKEAALAEKERAEIITAQPGLIMQPGPFQTNPDWAEEIIMGPGPPKGWKKDKILQGYTESAREQYRKDTQLPALPSIDLSMTNSNLVKDNRNLPDASQSSVVARNAPAITIVEPLPSTTIERIARNASPEESMSAVSHVVTQNTSSSSSLDEAAEDQVNKSRPSMERRLSSAVENLKDTIKGWNWKRYEREDEVLSGLNERFNRLWDKATSYGVDAAGSNKKAPFASGRKRAGTNDSERYDWQRAVRNPEINDLHPPTVSKLPATRDAAAWMLLPPPSAAVMAGRSRPQEEPALRWPLAQIDRNKDECDQLAKARELARNRISESSLSTVDSKKIPDLSNSSSDESWSEGEDGDESHVEDRKRSSAPVEGWMPVMPKRSAQALYPTSQYWERDEAWRERRVW